MYIQAKYIGKDGIVGLRRFHEYEIEIRKTFYGYDVEIKYDFSTNEEFEQLIQYASHISVEQNWKTDLEDQ